MANLEFCDKHNMVAYLKKPSRSEGFQEIVVFINGSYIRRHLQLADVDGISVLSTTEIFDQLSLMGYVLTDDKLTFNKAEEGEGSGHPSEPQPPPSTAQPTHEEPIPNVPIPNVPDEAVYEEWDDRVERATNIATSLDAEQASDDEEDSEDSSKQGRMIEEIDQDARVTLVTPTQGEDQPED
ncbi:hypothetical protein Tco_0837178 [Tanacetum coccineum]